MKMFLAIVAGLVVSQSVSANTCKDVFLTISKKSDEKIHYPAVMNWKEGREKSFPLTINTKKWGNVYKKGEATKIDPKADMVLSAIRDAQNTMFGTCHAMNANGHYSLGHNRLTELMKHVNQAIALNKTITNDNDKWVLRVSTEKNSEGKPQFGVDSSHALETN